MAATTTLKLPEELKARIAPLADSSAKTPHAWMIEALEAQARLAEMRQSFINDALASAAEVDAGGGSTPCRTYTHTSSTRPWANRQNAPSPPAPQKTNCAQNPEPVKYAPGIFQPARTRRS